MGASDHLVSIKQEITQLAHAMTLAPTVSEIMISGVLITVLFLTLTSLADSHL